MTHGAFARSVVTMRSLIAVAVALCCAGCGSASAVEEVRSTAPPYPGPLTARAAVAALECDGKTPFSRYPGVYDDGLASVQSSPEEAFDNYVEEAGIGYQAPRDGYRVERKDDDRALVSYDTGERTKVAAVLADGIRDFSDDVGWGLVAIAQCDPAELPAEVTEDLGIGIWENAAGRRAPFTRIHSRQGPEHCDWTDITFLLIGPDDKNSDWYVRDTKGEFADLLRGTFHGDATLPDDATDTGWHRSGRELWLAKDAAYLVGVDDVERWPAAKEPIMCA